MSILKYLISIITLFLLVGFSITVFAAPLAQSSPQPIFQVYGDSPVLEASEEAGAWDSGSVAVKAVIVVDGIFYMFYDGTSSASGDTPQSTAVGYATSNDGINWERAASNPILTVEDVPFANVAVNAGPVFVEDDGWTMYFSTVENSDFSGGAIGRATTSDVDGEWEIDPDPILVEGETGTWDAHFIFASSVVRTEDGIWLYYTGFGEGRVGAVGLATSADGVAFTKYDDPETTEDSYAASDPIALARGESADWDSGEVIQPFVRLTEGGFEMFYMGLGGDFSAASLGYATSEDGINWSKIGGNPVVSNADGDGWAFLSRPQAVVIDDGTYRLYFNVLHATDRESAVFLAVGIVQ